MTNCSVCQKALEEEHLEQVNSVYICSNCKNRLREKYVKRISDKKASDRSLFNFMKCFIVGANIAIFLFLIYTLIL